VPVIVAAAGKLGELIIINTCPLLLWYKIFKHRCDRCDILTNEDPPTCHHCKQYDFECTFFLPITETRFKKKKLDEEAAEKEKSKRDTTSPQSDHPAKADTRIYGMSCSGVGSCLSSYSLMTV
jgi:hypothetical protein